MTSICHAASMGSLQLSSYFITNTLLSVLRFWYVLIQIRCENVPSSVRYACIPVDFEPPLITRKVDIQRLLNKGGMRFRRYFYKSCPSSPVHHYDLLLSDDNSSSMPLLQSSSSAGWSSCSSTSGDDDDDNSMSGYIDTNTSDISVQDEIPGRSNSYPSNAYINTNQISQKLHNVLTLRSHTVWV